MTLSSVLDFSSFVLILSSYIEVGLKSKMLPYVRINLGCGFKTSVRHYRFDVYLFRRLNSFSLIYDTKSVSG